MIAPRLSQRHNLTRNELQANAGSTAVIEMDHRLTDSIRLARQNLFSFDHNKVIVQNHKVLYDFVCSCPKIFLHSLLCGKNSRIFWFRNKLTPAKNLSFKLEYL
jgi:hypothetical protein